MLVLSDKQRVVQLGLDGKLIAEHALATDFPVQHIATAVDAGGKRYVLAWANLGRQVVLLDAGFKQLASYPEADQPHDGIRDCVLADLDGDGTPAMYVAFWGAAGVHEVSLDGKRSWTNRAVNGPTALTIAAADAAGHRRLLVSTSTGDLLPLNPYGREEPLLSIGSYAVYDLIRSPTDNILTPFCGLSFTAEGTTKAIAVDADFVERWSYELPPGRIATRFGRLFPAKPCPTAKGIGSLPRRTARFTLSPVTEVLSISFTLAKS